MTKAEYIEHLEIPTLGTVLANVARMRSFTRPETKGHALYDHFLCDSFALFFRGGAAIVVIVSTPYTLVLPL